MKLLFILLTIVFISCEEQQSNEAPVGETSSPESETFIVDSSVVVAKSLDIIDGSYKSECVDEGSNGHYYMINIANYEIEITKFNTNGNCELIKSHTTATYNVNGDDLDYVETVYNYSSMAGGSYICDQSQMTSGDYFNIDGIDCSASYENVQNVLSMNEDEQYVVNGEVFSEI